MAFDVYAIPFSFNGPCASHSGAGIAFNAIQAIAHDERCVLLNQGFYESAHEYLMRAEDEILLSERCVVLGGNHLSCLPAHIAAKRKNLYRIILDAHRDYGTLTTGNPTHANFLSIVDDMQNVLFYGYRDGVHDRNCEAKQFRRSDLSKMKALVNSLPKQTRFYVDVDLDVIDPSIFPATGCPLPEGLTISNVIDTIDIIGLDRIDIISFEEYMPILDDDEQCLRVILNLFEYVAKSWRQDHGQSSQPNIKTHRVLQL